MGVSMGEGGDGGIFVGECGGELGGVVVGVCVGWDVGVGMREPVVPGSGGLYNVETVCFCKQCFGEKKMPAVSLPLSSAQLCRISAPPL